MANPAQMQVVFNTHAFDNTLAAVWNIVRTRGEDKGEMVRRLAEEIAEGQGKCAGGRVCRLVNSLRGFVDVGIQIVHEREDLGDEFVRSVLLPQGWTAAQRRAAAERVLDAHGVFGTKRAEWLDHLADL